MQSAIISLLTILVPILGSGSAAATADGPDFYRLTGVDADDVLNIRTEPNARAAKIGAIPSDGTCIRNLGCQGGLTYQESIELSPAERKKRLTQNPRWCRVQYEGTTGWVAGRFLKEGSCSQTAAAEQQLKGDVYSPENGVICDMKSGFCADRQGISMGFTKEFLGQEAQDKMMEQIRAVGEKAFDPSVYTLSDGVHCDSGRKKCFAGKLDDAVERAHTAALFGD